MTSTSFLGRYWRVPVVALLAAVLAFGASFGMKKSYTSNTRMLIVEGSTTLLSSSGQPISSQPGVNSPALAQTLAQTQAGLASSRQVATIVVDKLHLDRPKPKHGIIHAVENAASSILGHLKGWVMSGTYSTLPPREKAIQSTEKAVVASDLAPTTGPDTGQTDSYILEISATGSTAAQARDIANAAADALINVSQERFKQDSQSYVNALSAQLAEANASLTQASEAVSNYESANGISALDQQLVFNVQNQGTLQSQVVAAQAAVQGDEQAVASLQSTLASTPATETSNQSITTGRSTTGDATTGANPVYQSIQDELGQAQANLAADQAKVRALQSQQQSNPSSSLTHAQSQLLDLEEQVTADQNAVQTLSNSLQAAQANVKVSPSDLSRLGTADLPQYPSSPKRDMYLLLGLILGALAGGGLTYRAMGRRSPVRPDGDLVRLGSGPEVRADEDLDATAPALVGAAAGPHTNGDGRHGSTNGSDA